ncbi:MAG: lipoprotein signal peptidase [Flavobacteriales bacterium]|nr:lipoprotein signal peptidase [Flavobacteriales bacterium]
MKNINLNPWGLIFFLLCLDQALKLWIKTNMNIGDEIIVTNWFIIHFVENNGFAFGWEFFGSAGKLFLTIFRVVFAFFVFRWLRDLIKENGGRWVVFSMALIFAGAVGNIIDSVFYGVFFDYAPLFFGRVVDMFYFPIIDGYYPDWFPVFGGEYFVFFRYIFNVADSCITIGAFVLLFNYKNLSLK